MVWLISKYATAWPNREESSDPADGAENLPDSSKVEHTLARGGGQKEPEESSNGRVLQNGVWSAGHECELSVASKHLALRGLKNNS